MGQSFTSSSSHGSASVSEVAEENCLPIVYREEYNVKFWGLEKLHPFDSTKWGNIFKYLKEAKYLNESSVMKPDEVSEEILKKVHPQSYLDSLKLSQNVARIAEVAPLVLVPNSTVQKYYLTPMRYQVGGSILAGTLAIERGWAINIGGGFHHCSSIKGGGFCPYADITLLTRTLFEQYKETVKSVMILDLDAHQGNGYAHDFLGDEKVHIVDFYNKDIYPQDTAAKQAIATCVELDSYTKDDLYLRKVEENVRKCLSDYKPSVLVYNAGTDILEGDPLGLLSISPNGIIKRDEIVFSIAKEEKVPIVMVTSGGYTKESARIIADSILNLDKKGFLPHNTKNKL